VPRTRVVAHPQTLQRALIACAEYSTVGELGPGRQGSIVPCGAGYLRTGGIAADHITLAMPVDRQCCSVSAIANDPPVLGTAFIPLDDRESPTRSSQVDLSGVSRAT